MKHHVISGSQGVRLNVIEAGDAQARTILFIHGWSQSSLSWAKQLSSALAERYRLVAFDLRGHGDSDKPADGYTNSQTWAADVRAVIDELSLDKPVLVGWSYGGLVMNDYVRCYGESGISGLVYVGAATDLGVETEYQFLGASWNGLLPERPDSVAGTVFSENAEEVATAMRRFVRGCFAEPLPLEDEMLLLGVNLQCPSRVRAALFSRSLRNDDLLAELKTPVLVMHGDSDEVVRMDTGRHITSKVKGATMSVFQGAGHAPFWEQTERFNRELAEFVSGVW